MGFDQSRFLRKDDIRQIERMARMYGKLSGTTVTIYSLVDGSIEITPIEFGERNFAHLVGLVPNRRAGVTATDVYRNALAGRLNSRECMLGHNRKIFYKKTEVFPVIANIAKTARQIGDFDEERFVRARSDKVAGRGTACLGLRQNEGSYVPNSVLNESLERAVVSQRYDNVVAITRERTHRRRKDGNVLSITYAQVAGLSEKEKRALSIELAAAAERSGSTLKAGKGARKAIALIGADREKDRMDNMKEKLESLMYEDEAIAEITRYENMTNTGAWKDRIIVDATRPLDMQDIHGCMEDTLHRLVDAGASREDIEEITGMLPRDSADLDNYMSEEPIEVDLGYVFPGTIASIEIAENRPRKPESVPVPVAAKERPTPEKDLKRVTEGRSSPATARQREAKKR